MASKSLPEGGASVLFRYEGELWTPSSWPGRPPARCGFYFGSFGNRVKNIERPNDVILYGIYTPGTQSVQAPPQDSVCPGINTFHIVMLQQKKEVCW